MSEKVTLTTTAGAPIGDNQDAITAGRHGPLLLQDYQLLEKLAHQNRERIPERTVHAKAGGRTALLRSPTTSRSTPRRRSSQRSAKKPR